MRAESQSADEFQAVTYLYEVILKYECMAALAYLHQFDDAECQTLGYGLVYSDGLGIWAETLQKAINALSVAGKTDLLLSTRAYTQRYHDGEVGAEVVELARDVWDELGESNYSFAKNRIGIVQFLVALRNRTRGHGAPTDSQYEAINRPLTEIAGWLIESSPFLALELVKPMKLKSGAIWSCRLLVGYPTQQQQTIPSDQIERSGSFYIRTATGLIELPDFLVYERADDACFFLNSGRKTNGASDFLDYLTNLKKSREVEWFQSRPIPKPTSSTAGREQFDWDTFPINNLPTIDFTTYVPRSKLETELHELLVGKAINFVSLAGAGGVGKTTLAIRVARQFINEEGPFEYIVWFSARDVDLDERAGPLGRRRQVATLDACAQFFCRLMAPMHPLPPQTTAIDHFASVLSKGSDRVLLIFDNFESFDDTAILQDFIKRNLSFPGKALITSRERAFQGDYPLEVAGLSFDETRDLVIRTSRQAGCEPRINEHVVLRIYEATLGNPYAIKLLVNELARSSSLDVVMPKVLGQDYLAALFRRSFERASDDAQYLFLLVCLSVIARSEELASLLTVSHGYGYDDARSALLNNHLLDVPDEVRPGTLVYRISYAAQQFAQKIIVGHRAQRDIERDCALLQELGDANVAEGSLKDIAEFLLLAIEKPEAQKDALKRSQLRRGVAWILEHDADSAALYAFDLRKRGQASVEDQRQAFKRAVELNPANAAIWLAWAELEDSEGDFHRALDLNLRAADQSETLDLLVTVGRNVNSLLTKFKEMVPVYRRQVYTGSIIDRLERHFDELRSDALSVLGWLYLISNDRPNSKRCAEEGLRRNPGDALCQNLLAKLPK